MTGWRIGWLSHPENLGSHIAKLVQISTTGVPEFLQENATPELLAEALIRILDDENDAQLDVFLDLKKRLGRDYSTKCANAIEEMVCC